ncbi:Uncharacterized protein APZ42_015125 [Daphnia magna]|uniref:Uncharacterized protein n=1 Tax=Daphnia magna TaxID=35525 RepID=A0A162P7E7_9CRUS|nr:Uncharacterized protein APZ42_015125 [Daphnia magna]
MLFASSRPPSRVLLTNLRSSRARCQSVWEECLSSLLPTTSLPSPPPPHATSKNF